MAKLRLYVRKAEYRSAIDGIEVEDETVAERNERLARERELKMRQAIRVPFQDRRLPGEGAWK